MKTLNKLLVGIGLCTCLPYLATADMLVVEAESGALGSSFDSATDTTAEPATAYIAINSTLAGQAPTSVDRITTYELEFPAAGEYNLYVRLRNGPEAGAFEDDSFYYGAGFGAQDINNADAWVTVNNIAGTGYFVPEEIVEGSATGSSDPGSKHERWKWVKLSNYSAESDPGITFTVTADALMQTFQIAGREDGLWIDKFVFAPVGTDYTVQNLDDGVAPEQPADETPIAEGQEKYLGNIYSASQVQNFTAYWNQVAPENAGKWGSVEATRDVMNWAQLDAAYALAQDNNLPFRMHVMIWGNQQPEWIKTLPAEEQREEIEEWFTEVAARYSDIEIIEIVNEPVNDAPDTDDTGGGNYIEALGGTGETGWDWIITAFELGRTHFPDTKLMINEYSVTNGSNINPYLEIIELLQDRDLIDVIGVQAHAFSTTVSAATTISNLDRLAATGLPIYVTEMDIDACENNPDNDAVQLANYQRIFPAFWEHPGVAGVTLWGWRPGLWRNDQGAYLVRSNGEERPALTWLREYVQTGEVGTITPASCNAASSSSSSQSSSSSSSAAASSAPASSGGGGGGGASNTLLLLLILFACVGRISASVIRQK